MEHCNWDAWPRGDRHRRALVEEEVMSLDPGYLNTQEGYLGAFSGSNNSRQSV